MRLGGTASKRVAVGGTALVAGMAAASLGLATPALADATLDYTCHATLADQQDDFALAATTLGSVTGTPKVGDAVSLTGFQTTMTATVPILGALGVTHVNGSFDALTVAADNGGPAGTASPSSLAIDSDVTTDGGLTLSTPAAPETLTGFTAQAEGDMSFGLGQFTATLELTNADGTDLGSATVSCTGGGTFTSTTVAPADTGGGGTGTGGTGGGNNGGGNGGGNTGGGNTGGGNAGGGNTGGGSTAGNGGNTGGNTSTGTGTTTTTTTGTQNVTSARGTLASTGAPYVVPLSASGAALVLLGAGMLAFGRRRRAEDGLTGEVATVED